MLQKMLLRASGAMNNAADPSLLAESRCLTLIGLSSRSPGVLERSLYKRRLAFLGAPQIDGLFWYSGADAASDRLLVVRGGLLYTAVLSITLPTATTDAIHPALSGLTAVTNQTGDATPFETGKRVRAVQDRDEMFFVQEGGLTPLRFDGSALYRLGIVAPGAPVDGGNLSSGVMEAGQTYLYAVTYADGRGRESSPSPYLTVEMGAGGGRLVTWTAPTDPQVQRVYLYRSAAGGTLLYRVAEVGFPTSQTSYTDTAVPDATLLLNTQAPPPTANDPPEAASLIAKYKNRLVLNALSDRSLLQFSASDNPIAFAPLGDPDRPTQGTRLSVADEYGTEISALGHLGSGLGVWTRGTVGVLLGDTPDEFAYKRTQDVGCISPDSVVECDNVTLFLGEDGVYALAYQDGFTLKRLSDDLNDFQDVSVSYTSPGAWPPVSVYTREERGRAAIGWFAQGRYYLACPPWLYIYDLRGSAWSLDYMTNMPDSIGGLSRGYQAVCVCHAGRAFDIALYTPGIGSFTSSAGQIWCGSYYPLLYETGETGDQQATWNFVYETRFLDGDGVHRRRRKQMKRARVFGDITVPPGGTGDPQGFALASGVVTLLTDGAHEESYPFDNVYQIGTEFAGAYFARDQQQGMLLMQHFTRKAEGRGVRLRIEGVVTGRLRIRDIVVEYFPVGDE